MSGKAQAAGSLREIYKNNLQNLTPEVENYEQEFLPKNAPRIYVASWRRFCGTRDGRHA